MADWQKIKTEYITTDTSYRKLAEKYGIHYKVISDRGKAEEWVHLRSQHKDKTITKILDAVSDEQAGRAVRLQKVTDKLLSKVETLVDGCNPLEMDTQSLRHISATLKDIKDIQMIRSDADMREQEARIANLQKQAEKGDSDQGKITVVLEGALKDYAQ